MATPPTFVAESESATWTGADPKTASVTVQANDILVVVALTEDAATCTLNTPTGGSLTYNLEQSVVVSAFTGAYVWTAVATGSSTFSVSISTATGSGKFFGFTVYQFRGSDGVGNSSKTNSASGAPSLALTTAADNSAVVVGNGDWNAGDGTSRTWRTINGITPTAGNNLERVYFRDAAVYTTYSAYWNDAGTAGSQTTGLSAPSGQKYAIVAVEVKGASAAAVIPYNPQRSVQLRDAGETYWAQKDRRDANLVATPANDLAPPLLVPEHSRPLYAWSALLDRRLVPQQPNRVGDMSLFATAANDLAQPLFSPADGRYWHLYNDTAVRDRRQYFAQRPYVSADPNLLTPAGPLDPTLAGFADRSRRQVLAATHADRRQVPQQRTYPDRLAPVTLTSGTATAQAWWSEDVLTYQVQRIYFGPPATPPLVTAGAGTAQAWWSEDVLAYQAQRAYLSDPSLFAPVPTDPTLSAWLLTWIDANRAATHADRREVPQQRPYLSDPSFYPTTPPTDPLTLAWGAGGSYWHRYNQAADITPRWWPPQQRSYPDRLPPATPTVGVGVAQVWWSEDVQQYQLQRPYTSDPSLLATALLESPLLVGASRQFPTRPQWMPQRPQWTDPNQLIAPFDPLTVAAGVGGGTWRRVNTPATHVDRRATTYQPPRIVLYFDAGPGSPPLTLAWGAGGGYWHRYNQAAGAAGRVWQAAQRLVFIPLVASGSTGIIHGPQDAIPGSAAATGAGAMPGGAGGLGGMAGAASPPATVALLGEIEGPGG